MNRSKDFYFKLFNEELSITQALLDNTNSFWVDNINPHLTFLASILRLFDTSDSPSSFARWLNSKHRLEDLHTLYMQKRTQWQSTEAKTDWILGLDSIV